jgi:Zn-finger nucleic acid-binding protein
MKCVSCNAEIPAEYKFAIKNNLCPCCGGKLLDEAMLSSVIEVIKNEVSTLNDETAKNLAVALIGAFNFGVGKTSVVNAEQKKVSSKKDEILAQINAVQAEEEAIAEDYDEIAELKDEVYEEVLKERYPELGSSVVSAPKKQYPKYIEDDNDILGPFEKHIGHELIDQKKESAQSGLASGKGGFRRG